MQRDGYMAKESAKGIWSIPVQAVKPNPRQARRTFDHQAMDALADSIRQVGLLQPISVRKTDATQYELIAGERRLRACRQLGFVYIDAIVIEASATRSALLCLVENLQREDLHCFDEAEGYAAVLAESQMTQEWLAIRIGKSQSAIANKLRLLRLPQEVRDMARRTRITERHARALLRLPNTGLMLEAIDHMAVQKLTASQGEALVTSMLAAIPEQGKPNLRKVVSIVRDQRLYINAISDIVRQMKLAGIDADMEIREAGDTTEVAIRMPSAKMGGREKNSRTTLAF